MINRRIFIASAAALAFTASAASAQEWKAKYPEITFAVIPPRTDPASPSATPRS